MEGERSQHGSDEPVFLSSPLDIPPWSLIRNASLGAHGAHAPNALPTPDTPSPARNGEILKLNMVMHISSGPTQTDKVVSIYHLSRFRE